MTPVRRRAFLCGAATLATLAFAPATLFGQGGHRVSRLAWLAGCWERASGPRLIEEHWTRPLGGLMLGNGRTLQGDSLVEFEQMRLFERGGRVVFAAAPSGQAPAEFESASMSDTAVTFANAAHDFPQRIVYRRRGADSVLASIEGTVGDRARVLHYPYGRVACP